MLKTDNINKVRASKHSDDQAFRVWAKCPSYEEDPRPYKCVASFRFLTDALDYIAAAQDRGVTTWHQSPTSNRRYGPEDTRAVYKPETTNATS